MADVLSQDEINALLNGGGDDGGSEEPVTLDLPAAEPTAPVASAATSAPAPTTQATPTYTAPPAPQIQIPKGDVAFLSDIPVNISIILCSTKMPLNKALNISTNSVVEFEKMKNEPADILINGKKFAEGQIVVVDEAYGIKITKILDPQSRETLFA